MYIVSILKSKKVGDDVMITNDFLDMVNSGVKQSTDNWGTGVILQDPFTKKILLAKRTDNGMYGGPGGKVENGESPCQGICRECKEESNVTLNNMYCYDMNLHDSPNGKNWVDFLFYSDDFDASNITNQQTEMEPFDWYTVEEALNLNLFPPTRAGLDLAMQHGLLKDNPTMGGDVIPYIECPTSASQIMDSPPCQYSYEEPEQIFTTHQWLPWD